jgi:hypothetical protein
MDSSRAAQATVLHSTVELNQAIREKLDILNAKSFQKKEGSRHSEEKPFLLPLPATPYELATWKTATEIVEARHQRGSTLFCSQFAPAGWHGKIGDSTLAETILDRIVHSSYTITIEGMDSMSKRKGLIN